ncbi:outer membrane protein assembly factor BamD [Prosthecomicrobium pneumaticum]|uniref:Outer membrane protein assembly factor BamD n=1 Tax=Prosthecomicrobium pneumaticum TaxID=81895 RepID=A0A7W9FR51_9HYPH|nr:outer membrane protein assembly factor BamD [Prosthecomicrobium pneumaticum]MBB5755268.1 outer membrane protein assembly factor BamD [Prosthecomicrobium pneumaticum]
MNEADLYTPASVAAYRRVGAIALRAAVLSSFLALAGCLGFGGDKEPEPEPETAAGELYNQGLAYMEKGKTKDAIGRFEEVDRQHPYSEWAKKAMIMTAYAHFKRGDHAETITAAKRYLTLYPSGADAAYAQYMIGESYFRQIPEITRDQKATREAMAAMQEVINRYPDSEYVDDARDKIIKTRDQLAGKEMQVGRYYLERREYIAAVNRFKVVITEYSDTRHAEEALYRLTESYLSMGIVPEAQTAAAVLGHNFPDSPWYKDAFTLLQTGGVAPQENKGSWISKAFQKVVG